jgi:hypothetical protein
MVALNKEDIAKANDRKLVEVDVPEWGGSVFLGKMVLSDLLAFWGENYDENGKPKKKDLDVMLDMLLKSLMDKEGNRLFEDEDRAILASKDSEVLARLFKECSSSVYLDPKVHEALKKN